jgi:hypothetical protein
MEKIKLNFINRSEDVNNSSVVLFQQNVPEDFGQIAIAWKVIENCGRLDNHPFDYPMDVKVSGGDSYGNYTPQLGASNGEGFDMIYDLSGNTLQRSSTSATSGDEIEVRNNLAKGTISANCYRDGKLVAVKSNLAPSQKAVFQFHPVLYIGVISQVEEGDVLNSAIISQVNEKINLFGIRSADIIMTGGGAGKKSSEFNFTLENINK